MEREVFGGRLRGSFRVRIWGDKAKVLLGREMRGESEIGENTGGGKRDEVGEEKVKAEGVKGGLECLQSFGEGD